MRLRIARFQLRDFLRRSFSQKIPQFSALFYPIPQLRERSRYKKAFFTPVHRVPVQKTLKRVFCEDCTPIDDLDKKSQKVPLLKVELFEVLLGP